MNIHVILGYYQMFLTKGLFKMIQEPRLLKSSMLWSVKRIMLFCLMVKSGFLLMNPG